MLSRATKVLLEFRLEFFGRELRQRRFDHCQTAVETTALLDERGLDTEFGYLVHLAAGVVLKLLPLPIAGQAGRRGIAPLGYAPSHPDAAGFALARTPNNLICCVQSAQVPAVARMRHADSTGNSTCCAGSFTRRTNSSSGGTLISASTCSTVPCSQVSQSPFSSGTTVRLSCCRARVWGQAGASVSAPARRHSSA